MRSIVLGLVLAIVPALANSQEAPTPNWTGFYVGLNGGYGSADFGIGHPTEFDVGGDIFRYRSFSADDSGWVGGGQIGYNFQTGQFVFGVEADLQGADIDASKTFRNAIFDFPTPAFDTVAQTELNYFGTVRGRLGYALSNRLLLYGTEASPGLIPIAACPSRSPVEVGVRSATRIANPTRAMLWEGAVS